MSVWDSIGNLGGVRRTTSNGPEAIAIVEGECGRVNFGRPKGLRYDLPCPFHVSDGGFSRTLNVNLNPSRVNAVGFNVPVGWFYCWSCRASGPWNRFANHLGLQTLEETDNPDIEHSLVNIAWDEDYIKPDASLLAELTFDWVRKDNTIYRETLMDFGAMEYQKVAFSNGEYEMRRKILLPCRQNHVDHGHVEIRIEDDDPEEKYLNAKGPWSHRFWIGFDLVRRYFGSDCVAIVEGPADFLRMVQNNIPALPLLGVSSWSREKRAALETGFRRKFVIGDGDSAGRGMRDKLLADMPDAKAIDLPDGTDPASISRSDIKEIDRIMRR